MLRRCGALLLGVLTLTLIGCGGPPAANIEATIAAGVAATQAASVPTSSPVPTTPPSGGKWRILNDTSSFDDSETVVLTLAAEEPYRESWLNQTHTPVLLLRCREGRTEAYINVGFAPTVEVGLVDKGRARIRFDQGTARTEIMDKSTDGEALFFGDPFGIISEIERSERLIFGYTPINADPVETSFDVRGVLDLLPQLREQCPPPAGAAGAPTAPPRPTAAPTPVVTPVDPLQQGQVEAAALLARSPGEAPRAGGWVCEDALLEVIGRADISNETWYQVRVARNPNCRGGPAAVNSVGWLKLDQVIIQ